jgi:hypothetical protein
VVRASSWWQQLVNLIPRSLPIEFQWKRFSVWQRSHVIRVSRQIATICAIFTIGFWFWKLWLAIGAGSLVAWLVYRLQQQDWQAYWVGWLRFARDVVRQLYTTNPHLTLAVGCGGVTALSTYVTISIWVAVQNHWLATWLILQGFGTLAILILLVWQILSYRRANRQVANLNFLLMELTDIDPHKRAIARRRLTQYLTDLRGDLEQQAATSISATKVGR